MAKRIHDIAKELGIKSKAIIDKCIAEGIPAEKVRNHMATVSPGLEATIREWFAGGGGGGTAVEMAEQVDLERVRAKPRRRTAKQQAESASSDGETATATAAPPAPEAPAAPAAPAAPRIAPPEPASEPTPAPSVFQPIAPAARATPMAAPAAPATPAAPAAPAPQAPTETPAPGVATPARPAATTAQPIAPAARAIPAAPATPTTPAAPTPPPTPGQAAPTTPGQPPADGQGGAGVQRRPVVRPAPMNVPNRPKIVGPAGPTLKVQTPVKLTGPKVVRIEAPEIVDRPRPRRPLGGPGEFIQGGRGPGGPMGPIMDDEGRSPRRNKRRPSGPSSPLGKAGAAGGRRRVALDEPPVGVWSEQDLAEREARLARSGGFLKKRRHDLKNRTGGPTQTGQTSSGPVRIAAPFTIKDLSAAAGVKVSDIVKRLFMQGVMATANSGIDPIKAQEIMLDMNIELEVIPAKSAEELVSEKFAERKQVDVRPRGPIVTILGHVDHGKTSLLDRIRNTNVAAGEAGGITQATSAFRVPVEIGGETKHIVFLDTPGHEAFTSMRARGAKLTDVVVLVVSAPEGVMPQTIESINHAKAANVPIVVALNKIDRPDATEARVNQTLSQLAEQGLNPVEWGGSTEVIRTSATKGTGIDQLLEILDLQAQILELKADYGGPARGTVVESRMEEGRGAVANVIVQDGELKVGDFIVVGRGFGRVRDIIDDRGNRLKKCGPATPVQISGFDELPDPGDKFFIVDSLKEASEAAEQRRQRERQAQLAQPKVTLDSLFSQMAESAVKEIRIVLKADVQGSVDVIKSELEKIATSEVKTRVLHAAVGGITDSDVLLADASKAIVIGFNVIPSGKARHLAENKGVEIRSYQVIYEIMDDVRKAAEGLLAPELRQEILGHAEVRRVFKVSKVGTIAGCYVTDGSIERNALIRVTRNGVVIENDRVLEQLKRFKDDAREVKAGMECGMKIAGYDDIKEGDILECYKKVEVKRSL